MDAADEAGIERPPPHSGARLDLVVMAMMMDTKQLSAAVSKRAQATLGRHASIPKGRHPLIIEIWRVSDGRMEPGGRDLHSWSERAGRGLGMVLSLGRSAGVAANLGRLARQVSEVGSKVLGSFNEVMVTVPHIEGLDPRIPSPSLVLGMYTDSPISRLGDRIFGFGFDKRIAHIVRSGFERFEVREPDGKLLLQARLAASGEIPITAKAPGALLRTCLAKPLIGKRGRHGLVLSRLDRFFEGAQVRVRGAVGSVVIGDGFIDGIHPGENAIEPATARHPWGAFSATNVSVKLSFPIAVG